MKKSQVISIDKMHDLELLGVDIIDASAYIFKDEHGLKTCFLQKDDSINTNFDANNIMRYYLNDNCIVFPTYTLEDIIDKLPQFVMIDGGECRLIISKDIVKYENIYTKETVIYQPVILSMLSSAFEVFKYLLSNKLI